MRESKSERFCRVAEARVNKIIKMIRLLGNCSGVAYEHTPEQVQQIFTALQTEIDNAKQRYTHSACTAKKRFSLSEELPAELEEGYSSITLPLPDGSYLQAVAIDDENFPAINIYLNCGVENPEGVICFAEYNPERGPCHEICIGAYRSDEDETVYYKPYMAERNSNERD